MTFGDRVRQQALRARCAHPSGAFERFEPAELEQSVAGRFEPMVRRAPARLAVKTRSDALTYEALNRAANQVAHALLARMPGDPPPAALLLRNGAAFVVASLGAAKAARVQVVLDRASRGRGSRPFPRDRSPTRLKTSRGSGQAVGPMPAFGG